MHDATSIGVIISAAPLPFLGAAAAEPAEAMEIR
jgi:hypothetical protein